MYTNQICQQVWQLNTYPDRGNQQVWHQLKLRLIFAIGVSTTIMPKQIEEVLKLEYEHLDKGFSLPLVGLI